jgi:hypothetical protein
MKSDFNLSLEDIKPKNENALELFYSGIKSVQTEEHLTAGSRCCQSGSQ